MAETAVLCSFCRKISEMLWEHVCSNKCKLVWMGKGRIQPHVLLGEWIQALSVEVFLRSSVVFAQGGS